MPTCSQAANVAAADRLLVALPNVFEAGQVIAKARKANPHIHVCARAETESEVEHLRAKGADTVVVGRLEIATAMMKDAFGTAEREDAPASDQLPPAPVDGGAAGAAITRFLSHTETPMAEAKFEPRVFSGIQPSGNLTLGNYLGALRRWVEMQDDGIPTLYCVVDLHAITVWQDPAALRHATREVAAAFLAIGLDPARSILFNQSQVPAHAQLAWIFNCVARLGWLNRMTQFKDKAGKDREAASVGLYAYPALMAADILLYHGTHVPVGEDQKQHVELTRDIAAKFNHDFGVDFFPLPEPVIEGAATRVMSLRDGTKKMSKSDPSDMSRINLTDDADTIAQKIRKARTDPDPLPETRRGARGPAGGAQPRQHLCRARRDRRRRRCWPSSPASPSRPSSRRWPTWPSPTSPRSRRAWPATWPTPPRSTASSATGRSAPRRSPRRSWRAPTRSSDWCRAGRPGRPSSPPMRLERQQCPTPGDNSAGHCPD